MPVTGWNPLGLNSAGLLVPHQGTTCAWTSMAQVGASDLGHWQAFGFRSADSFNPKKVGSVHLGGIVRRAAHPKKTKQELNAGPKMVEISRDGRRVYFTNSLYAVIDEQFYSDGVRSWMAKVNTRPEGGMELDRNFFLEFDELRSHQVHLEGQGPEQEGAVLRGHGGAGVGRRHHCAGGHRT